MRDLDKALADIGAIRSQLAAGTAFRGYGPAALAATGALALLTAAAQALWLDAAAQPLTFLGAWFAVALVCVAIVGVEMRRRAHRHHSGLADAMIRQAIEQFLPAGAAGALLGVVIVIAVPDAMWMLPGLWQMLVGLGLFAALRSLPRRAAMVGAWYVLAGLGGLMLASDGRILSPWLMGVPFAVGQAMMAMIVRAVAGESDAEA